MGEQTGGIYLTNHRRARETRKTPGSSDAPQKGDVRRLRDVQNGSPGKGHDARMMCFGCRFPGHFWEACRRPFNPGKGGNGKGKAPGRGKWKTSLWEEESHPPIDDGQRANDLHIPMEHVGHIPIPAATPSPTRSPGVEGSLNAIPGVLAQLFDGADPWAAYYAQRPDQSCVAFSSEICTDVADHSI